MPRPPHPAVALLAFILLSSILGLTGRSMFLLANFSSAYQFFIWTWTRSILADLIFVLGSGGAALAAWSLARAQGALVSVVASLALNWLVYWLSYTALAAGGHAIGGIPIGPALWFVGAWGAVGLAFAAVAPAAYARWQARA